MLLFQLAPGYLNNNYFSKISRSNASEAFSDSFTLLYLVKNVLELKLNFTKVMNQNYTKLQINIFIALKETTKQNC